MSFINAYVRRIFGGKSGDAIRWNTQDQALGESLPVATYNRKFKGPQVNGNWSYQAKATAAAGAGSTLKFSYSDLPDPDPANDAHWVDSGITAIDLTATATVFASVPAKFPEWIRAQAIILVSTGDLYLWVRAEGVEV